MRWNKALSKWPHSCRVTLTWMHTAAGTSVARGQHCTLSPRPWQGHLHRASPRVDVYSTVLNKTHSAASHLALPFNCSHLWFEGDEHHHVSPGGVHTALTASTRLTRVVAGSINPRGRSVKVSAQERGGEVQRVSDKCTFEAL